MSPCIHALFRRDLLHQARDKILRLSGVADWEQLCAAHPTRPELIAEIKRVLLQDGDTHLAVLAGNEEAISLIITPSSLRDELEGVHIALP